MKNNSLFKGSRVTIGDGVFATGSRVYGEPTDDSDYDIAIQMDEGDRVKLESIFKKINCECGKNVIEVGSCTADQLTLSMKVGKVNIIFIDSEMLSKWVSLHNELIDEPLPKSAYKRMFELEKELILLNKKRQELESAENEVRIKERYIQELQEEISQTRRWNI